MLILKKLYFGLLPIDIFGIFVNDDFSKFGNFFSKNILRKKTDYFFWRKVNEMKSKKVENDTINIVVAGVENSGKTSILKAIKGESIERVPSTHGFDISNIKMRNKFLNIYDLGGSKDQRNYWNCYIDACDALIYVIDGSDNGSFEETGKWLNFLLEEIQIEGVPVAIFVNKMDKRGKFLDKETVVREFGLDDIDDRQWKAFDVSAKSGKGILEGFEWVYSEVS